MRSFLTNVRAGLIGIAMGCVAIAVFAILSSFALSDARVAEVARTAFGKDELGLRDAHPGGLLHRVLAADNAKAAARRRVSERARHPARHAAGRAPMRHPAHSYAGNSGAKGSAPRIRQLFQLPVRRPAPGSIRAERARLRTCHDALPRAFLRKRRAALCRDAVAVARDRDPARADPVIPDRRVRAPPLRRQPRARARLFRWVRRACDLRGLAAPIRYGGETTWICRRAWGARRLFRFAQWRDRDAACADDPAQSFLLHRHRAGSAGPPA